MLAFLCHGSHAAQLAAACGSWPVFKCAINTRNFGFAQKYMDEYLNSKTGDF